MDVHPFSATPQSEHHLKSNIHFVSLCLLKAPNRSHRRWNPHIDSNVVPVPFKLYTNVHWTTAIIFDKACVFYTVDGVQYQWQITRIQPIDRAPDFRQISFVALLDDDRRIVFLFHSLNQNNLNTFSVLLSVLKEAPQPQITNLWWRPMRPAWAQWGTVEPCWAVIRSYTGFLAHLEPKGEAAAGNIHSKILFIVTEKR